MSVSPTLNTTVPGDATLIKDWKAASVYQELPKDFFRLLVISSEGSDTEVSCKLELHPVNRGVVYTALSYKWGSPPDTHTILLNGERVKVRKTLWRFLKEARELETRCFELLWIDALCINQANNEEKMQQVELMRHIFQNAQQVVVWLGPSYAGSDEAMDRLNRLTRSSKTRGNAINFRGKSGSIGIGLLCRRAYWTRLWILQEIVLARRISLMCGGKLAAWEPFHERLRQVAGGVTALDPESRRVQRWEDSIECQIIRHSPAMAIVARMDRHPATTTLFDLMIATQHLRCTDPRDKVYALLAISRGGTDKLRPDYDVPVTTLLHTVLKAHHEFEAPEDLETVERQCRQLADLSWVGQPPMFDRVDDQGSFPRPLDDDVSAYPLGREGSLVTLWWAAPYEHSAVVDLLTRDNSTGIPGSLRRAAREGSEATVTTILRSVPRHLFGQAWYDTALCQASLGGHKRVVQLLLEHGAKVDSRNEYGYTALSWAACEGHTDIVQVLIERGADVHVQHNTYAKSNILISAASNGRKDVVEVLLQQGADVKARDGFGGNALLAAASGGYEDVVQSLLDHGADVDMRDNFGTSALDEAKARGHKDVVRVLLQHVTILGTSTMLQYT